MYKEESIVLIGGGPHCKVVISIIEENKNFNKILISDIKKKMGKKILGYTINHTDDELEELFENGVKNSFITIGELEKMNKRIKIFKKLKKIGFTFPVIISSHAKINKTVKIFEGTIVMPGVIINVDSNIGKNCIINTGSNIDHDCSIGDHTHIAPGVTLSGNVKIGKSSIIGTGASVIDNIDIGDNVIIGAGSVVINDIPSDTSAVGVPAKIIKRKK